MKRCEKKLSLGMIISGQQKCCDERKIEVCKKNRPVQRDCDANVTIGCQFCNKILFVSNFEITVIQIS